LYDLTSTYFEGRLDHHAKAQRGYSRDHRPDCKQLCIGLVVNRDGLPLGWETLPGNRRDAPTLLPMITALERRFGTSQRLLCFDRGMATEANLRELRQSHRPYVCATRRAMVREHWPIVRRGPGTVVQATRPHEPAIEVHELPVQCHEDVSECPAGVRERWLLCRSAGCRLKEQQICAARLRKARQRLAKLQQQVAAGTFVTPAVILAKAKKAVGRTHDLRGVFAFALVDTPTGQQLQVQESAAALQDERDLQGVYLLRTTDNAMSADDVWRTYMLLTRVEAAFRKRKTDLSMRPIFHRKENRGDAHVLFSVLAYALSLTIQLRHRRQGGTLTTAALLEALQPLGLAELSYRTSDGNRLAFERAAVPSAEQQALLTSLGWPIPQRYLPPNLEAEPRRVV
jgi:transposase